MRTVLEGIRVIDFTHVWQGPLATQLLADFGAEVIKVERPGMGDWSRGYGPFASGMSLVFAGLNRNKRSIVVDVRQPAGKAVVLRLIRSADVLVHNFRPRVDEKLGLDYASLSRINPRLIHAHSSGWGDKGPYVEQRRKGHSDMAAAVAGLFKADSPGDLPHPPGISVDFPAGLILTQAILLGLLERERSGVGQEVSTDLFSAAVMAGMWHGGEALNPQMAEDADQDLASTDAAIPRAWRTRDGFLEVSAVFSRDALRDISLAMGLDDLSQDARFRTAQARRDNKAELMAILGKHFERKTTAQWLGILEPSGVLCAEINTYDQALKDPQLLANGMVVDVDQPGVGRIRLLGTPIRMSRTPASVGRAAPWLGEHTEELLHELGYLDDEIAELRAAGVIAGASENGLWTSVDERVKNTVESG